MKKIWLFGVCSILFWSCNTGSKNTNSTATLHEHEMHAHNHADGTMELNNGTKWMVNEEMKPFVQQGADLIQGFLEQEGNNFQELAERLEQQNSQLIQSCTMEGKGHEELHKWLHPHIDLVGQLAAESNSEKALHIVHNLQESYAQYQKFFH